MSATASASYGEAGIFCLTNRLLVGIIPSCALGENYADRSDGCFVL